MAEYPELLFFDTFSHGSAQVSSPELNLDLVQFTNPVYVTEIRVIPLGARVQADFPGGVRLGATNPSEFSIQFFVNDLSTPGASTFQNIGTLQYNQNGPIHHVCENKEVPTDGLILRGWYTTVTLAVYGFITKTRPPPSNLVPQNLPPAPETPPPRVISEHKTAEWVQQHAQVYHKEPVPYDVKDISFEDNSSEWPAEKGSSSQWIKHEPDQENTQDKEEKRNSPKDKKAVEEPLKASPKKRSCAENDLSDFDEQPECKKRDDKKITLDGAHHSPSESKSKSKNESKKISIKHEPEEVKAEPVVVVEKREKTPEPSVPSLAPVKEESVTSPTPVEPPPLAPEDVELISEEEISETEDAVSIDASCMQVMDEVTDVPNETLTPSVHEDSLDMDQFEPILSGSSDIESEEEIDFQDMEFDPNDLIDEPSKMFDPFLFEVQPLMSLKSPYMMDYEWELLQLKILGAANIPTEKTEKLKTLLSNLEMKPFDDAPDDWVTTVENIVPILETGLIGCEEKAEAMLKLTNIVNVGLDFDKAYHQPKPVFKVRHLKAGIRLVETLCRCGEDVTLDLIKHANVQHKLLNLYEREYIALSLKLAILRAVDVSLNYGSCVKNFLASEQPIHNGYRRLVKMFTQARTARVRYSLVNLLRKLHLFESLENLYMLTTDVAAEEHANDRSTQVVDDVVVYLEEAIRYLREAPRLICQPIRFLPICTRFEFPLQHHDPYFAVYAYFHHFHLLDVLLAVLSSPQYATHSNILSCLLELLAELLDTESGLTFLASQTAVTNRILKILSNLDEQYSLSTRLGLHMTHCMYALNLVDGFRYKWMVEQITDIDNTQLLEVVSSMNSLGFTSIGRQAVTHVLSRGDLIKPYLKALVYSRNTGRERRKSPGKAYMVDLIWMVVKYSDYVPFLERHRADLIEIASWQSDSGISSWLNPIRNDYFLSYNDVTELCDVLKKYAEKVITYPGELITALRILRYLAVNPANGRSDEENAESIELRYRYVLIQLFSQEGLTFITSMLHKVCNHYERPHLHAYTLAGKEGTSLMSFMLPALQLLRALLEYVVRCRDVEFKDLTAVSALLKSYCLMYVVPPTSPIHPEATEAGREIVETLLAYTQTVAIEPLSDSRSLHKSLWTSMISEVLKYSVSVPEAFAPCLSLLSELLPLPLPVQTRTPLTDVEISLVTNSRKLWSAHMLPLDGALQEMISTLCWSSYHMLLQLLKRVCVQLADLGSPSALVVARSILNAVWSEMQTSERFLSARCARLLNVFACLLSHPPLKMTVIQITSSGKSDETFAEFWPNLFKHLSQPYEGNASHAQAQEAIVSSVQCLCDIEISLYPPPDQSVSVEMYLSNSLPPKQLFRSACETLVKLGANAAENAFGTLSSMIRALSTLTEYDYGMFRLKHCLSEHPNSLYNVVVKLAEEWSKENADCVNCLTNLLEFFKTCLPREQNNEAGISLRTLSVSALELAEWLKWNVDREAEKKHPLQQIKENLSECDSSAEELYQSLGSNVDAMMDALCAAQPTDVVVDPSIEMILDPPESLLTQFQSRLVYVVGEVDDERLSVAYWLSVTSIDELEQEAEQVVCNLEEIVIGYIPNLQLQAELEKLGHREATHFDQPSKKSVSNELNTEAECKPIPTVLAVKPAKPRTFIRPIIGPHRNDAFRSRIPNSSRAPSLHVDDFIALEKHNQQQAATAAYNRIAGKHSVQDAADIRNRGHTFLQDRGNHFHSAFRPSRGILNTWHPLIAAEQAGRSVVKTSPSVIRHPAATPLMIRGSDLMRFSLSLRWPSPPLRPPIPQMRHHPPPHTSIHRHLRPPPSSF